MQSEFCWKGSNLMEEMAVFDSESFINAKFEDMR